MRFRYLLPLAVVSMLAAPGAASAYFPHTVVPGESLYSIAAADGLTVAQLAAANGISSTSSLRAGATVAIPPRVAGPSVYGSGSSVCDGDGDSDDYGCGEAPYTSYASSSSRSYSPAYSQPVGYSAEGSVTDPPYPTPERVSASQIGQVAASNGVSPALADAIAWQESGFNNAAVSTADARGVMQILPGTWSYIQDSLNPGTPLAPASAIDNVRGGVLLLHSLLRSTGGDSALAAAGYYQGLPSVERYGLFRDTRQYVADVQALERRFGGG